MSLDLLTSGAVPTWVMVLVTGTLTLSLLLGVPLARAAGKRRGRRLAHPELYLTKREKAKDTALFLAALVPSVLVWLAVMGVSFLGLTGFAADVMHWTHWTNMLVPLSLDGISVSFGAWAFVAVKRGRHPGRAYKIVLAAAAMSAVLNFVHGRSEWSLWAGLYLAFLSFAGMAMFHELLEQFMAAYDDEAALKSRYPRFGQRWFYAPFSTFAARRAWIVNPPREQLRPTVRNALTHLEDTREARRQRRLGGAMLVREEQQAKLVEIQARGQVKAARRGDYVPQLPGLTEYPPQEKEPEPRGPELIEEKPTAQEVDAVFDRLRRELSDPEPEPEPESAAPPRKLAAEFVPPTEPAPEPQPEASEGTTIRTQQMVEEDDDYPSLPLLPEQMRRQQREQYEPIPLFSGTDQRPTLPGRVRQALDAHVRAGDPLDVADLTSLVVRALGAPANRDDVARHVSTWVSEVRQGDHGLPQGARAAIVTQKPGHRLEYPFELLTLKPVTVNKNVVACPDCGTTATLQFSGFHPRRPLDARCGCGRRWPIVGLGSERVWDVLSDEIAAGRAQLL